MTGKSPEVYGTVTGVDGEGALLVLLDGGERGVAEFGEISRQANIRRDHLERMIGWHIGFIPGEAREDGSIRLSGRAYEEQEYRRVCDDFERKARNIYSGKLVSVTMDGKLAFYRLAQGVTGAMHVSAFSLGRVYSFRDIDLPKYLTVAVSGVDSRGWLSLSAKSAFGDFEYSAKRLALCEGQMVEGMVANMMADGAAAVMLAPNLSVLTDACCRVYPGDRVRLRIRRVDWEQHRVKAQMLERTEEAGRRFDYEAWNRPAEELPAYIDLAAFDEQIRLNKPQTQREENAAAGQEALDFSVSATRSPFSTYQNERIVREAHRPSRVQDIYFEARMGYLGEKHMKVADAVEALKYSSAWQVRRFLYLKDGLMISEREMKNIVDRLVKHNVVGVLRFQSDEGSLLTRVLHPSINYRALCGRNPRNFGPRDFMESDASSIKMRLASNQLLIGLMRSGKEIGGIETHPFLRSDEIEVRVRPRHMVLCDGKRRYLEAVRRGWEEEMLDKLRRYEVLLVRQREEAGVMVVLEDQALVEPMLERIAEMRLGYPVWLTDDLSCLPEPKLIEIPAAPAFGDVPAAAKALLQRLKQRMEDRV